MHSTQIHSLEEADWPKSVPAIQSIINNSPSRRLGGRAPVTVHTGMPSRNPLTVALIDCNIQGVESIDQARLQHKLNTDESLDKIHKDADQTLTASRKSVAEGILYYASVLFETTSLSLGRTDPTPRCPPIGSDLAEYPRLAILWAPFLYFSFSTS